jgi:hypothetical protein
MADEWHAAYYIAFGAHGPRAQTPPGEGWKVAGYTVLGVGVSLAVFVAIRMFAKGSPGTMNKEYQEATNEYLKVCFPLFRSSVVIVLSCFGWRERARDSEWEGKKREGKGERRGANIWQ